MAYVEAFLEFSMTYQEPKNMNTDYYALFKSRQDTSKAQGRQPDYHLKMYVKHWKILMVTEGIVDKQEIDTAKREEYAQLTMDSSCEELCSCLFMCQSNNKGYERL